MFLSFLMKKPLITEEQKRDLIDNTKKPVFYFGLLTWVAMAVFFFGSSLFNFKTGNVINSGETLGISNSVFFVLNTHNVH